MASGWRLAVVISAVTAAAAVAASSAKVAGAPATLPQVHVPTYSRDVAPIVQKNCQVCHRPGEAGPFSLLTYADARRRAAKIKNALVDGKMPPWFADPHYGKFSNAMGLSASEIDTIVKWIDGGLPEGDRRDLPKPAEWVEGWGIGSSNTMSGLPIPQPSTHSAGFGRSRRSPSGAPPSAHFTMVSISDALRPMVLENLP